MLLKHLCSKGTEHNLTIFEGTKYLAMSVVTQQPGSVLKILDNWQSVQYINPN